MKTPLDIDPPPNVERLFRSLLLIRRAEEEIAKVYPTDKIKSPIHLAIGQEAIAVGVCDALRDDDVAGGTYRSHAIYLAKGGDLKRMMAEMFGKIDGCARGKGGSMHLVAMEKLLLGSSAIVGTTIPVAVGYAFALQRQPLNRIAVAFFGDGATEEGCFYESLNFAKLQSLPILFVCENNGLAIYEPIEKRWGSPDLCRRVEGFGVATQRITDGDIFAIRNAATLAIQKIRLGAGPQFIECLTHRWREHVGPNEDYDQNYRCVEESERWRANDQVKRIGAMLPPELQMLISKEVDCDIAEAIRFAEASPFPTSEELYAHVYAD